MCQCDKRYPVPGGYQVAFAMEKGSMVELPRPESVFGAQVAGWSAVHESEPSEADLGPGQGHCRSGLGRESRTWAGCGLGPSVAQGTLQGQPSRMGRAVGRFRGVLRRGRAAPGSRVLRKPGVWESGVQVQIPEALTELWSGQEEFGVVHSGDNLTGALLQTDLHASG